MSSNANIPKDRYTILIYHNEDNETSEVFKYKNITFNNLNELKDMAFGIFQEKALNCQY